MQLDSGVFPAQAPRPWLANMTTLVEEPRFTVGSLQLLKKFQDAFRARVYNLAEDYVRASGSHQISEDVLNQFIWRAIRELSENQTQRDLDFNGKS
jgi:hypothetical protein